MLKIISAEIKKIVSRPGIYVLSVLLAIILVIGVFIYKPTVVESNQFTLSGSTFLEKYSTFNQANADKKAESLTKLNNSISSVNNYVINANSTTYTQKDYINYLVSKCNECYEEYQDSTNNENASQTHINNVKNNLILSFEALNSAIETGILNSQFGSYSILTSKENYDTYKATYKEVLAWAKITVTENLKEHFLTFESKYKDKFYDSIASFKYPKLSTSTISTYTVDESGTKLNTLNLRLNYITTQINSYHELATRNANNENITLANKMDELANQYVNTVDTYVNLVKYELLSNAFTALSTKDQLTTLYLSDFSEFDTNSLLTRYEYLFHHNKSEQDYAKPLTIGLASNDKTNAYDYAYFVLRIFSFVIIVYAIMSACHTIAGEIKEGTMRYLSIRPISRNNILFGKWFAIMIMSLILILFSGTISICVGGAVYGFSSQTILTIFNGNVALTLHPLLMLYLYLMSLVLELIVYSLIAMFVSSLFRSDLFSMTLLIVIFLVNTMLPAFIQGANTWLAFYPFSHISIYSLFGSSTYAVQNNFFSLMFGAKVYAGTHIALTSTIIILFALVFSLLAMKIFKRKEL